MFSPRPQKRSISLPSKTQRNQKGSSITPYPSLSPASQSLEKGLPAVPLPTPVTLPIPFNKHFHQPTKPLACAMPHSSSFPPSQALKSTKNDSTPLCTTLINPFLEIPQTLPPVELPPPQQETLETYRLPDKYLFRKPLPILKDSKELNVFTRHIPKQKEIDEFLKVLRAKVIHCYSLPILASEIQQAYKTSPAFKNIYQYITTNMLLSNKRAQCSIIANADNYIVAEGFTFQVAGDIQEQTTYPWMFACYS